MNKSKTARLIGFVGALGASAALVGAAINTTGAYFTDSHDGAINTSLGQVKVDTTDLSLNFANLLPGEYQTKRVDYTARGTGAEDIWLVFPDDGSSDAFTHTPQNGTNPLGRYGHLKITSDAGASFVSNNLALSPNGGYTDPTSCSIDSNGHGGNAQEAANRSDYSVPYCAPAHAILLASNLNYGAAGYANVEFGFTKLLRSGQGTSAAPLAKFKIVATQHGIRPDDPNN